MIAGLIGSLLIFQQSGETLKNDGSGETRIIVNSVPLPMDQWVPFNQLSATAFAAKADGKTWHLVKGNAWKALVSESYLPLQKMRQLAEIHERFAGENDLNIDKDSDPKLLEELKRHISEDFGLLGSQIARSPDFNAEVFSEISVTVERAGKSISVPLWDVPKPASPARPVKPVLDPKKDNEYRPNSAENPAKSPLGEQHYYLLPMCLNMLDIAPDLQQESVFALVSQEVSKVREEQRVKNRTAYMNFLNWANQSAIQVLRAMPVGSSVSDWPPAAKEQFVGYVEENYSKLGFGSPEEARLWAESGPKLSSSKVSPKLRMRIGDDSATGRASLTTYLSQSWLRRAPSGN